MARTRIQRCSPAGEQRKGGLLDALAVGRAVIDTIAQQMAREPDALTRGTHAQRLEGVSLLEGAPISRQPASAQLR